MRLISKVPEFGIYIEYLGSGFGISFEDLGPGLRFGIPFTEIRDIRKQCRHQRVKVTVKLFSPSNLLLPTKTITIQCAAKNSISIPMATNLSICPPTCHIRNRKSGCATIAHPKSAQKRNKRNFKTGGLVDSVTDRLTRFIRGYNFIYF